MNTATARHPDFAKAGVHERGSALIVGLVFLLVLTLIGVAAMGTTTMQERMAGNLRDRNLAFQAAEAALREGEQFLQQAALPPFDGSTTGLIMREERGGRTVFWNTFNWAEQSRAATAIPAVTQPPRYVIEEMPPIAGSGDSLRFGPLPDVGVYRVTARSTGGTNDAVVILQTTYRR